MERRNKIKTQKQKRIKNNQETFLVIGNLKDSQGQA